MSNDEHATKESITIDHAIAVLNRMLEADPAATRELILTHISCNEDLSNDPTIQVRSYKVQEDDPAYSVGILGLLNGLFGVDEGGWGPITANVKLVCTVGCEIPEGRPLMIGGTCPICKDRGKDESEHGSIIFGEIDKFCRTLPLAERRKGPPT
jgi:hypothetical protein